MTLPRIPLLIRDPTGLGLRLSSAALLALQTTHPFPVIDLRTTAPVPHFLVWRPPAKYTSSYDEKETEHPFHGAAHGDLPLAVLRLGRLSPIPCRRRRKNEQTQPPPSGSNPIPSNKRNSRLSDSTTQTINPMAVAAPAVGSQTFPTLISD